MNTYDEQVEKIMNNFDIQDFCWTDDSDNSRKLHTNRDVTEEVKSFIRSSLSSLRSTLEKPEEKDANDVNSLYLATKSEVGKVISEKWD